MIFSNREAAPKQPNFRVGIQFESVECQQGFERKIFASFTFTNQELDKKQAIPMSSPVLFDVFKEDYKQKLEVELYENDISIGQIALRLPARPDYIYEAQMEDVVNVDVKDHVIKIKYRFNVINKLISAQKVNNYKKRYHSNKRDSSFEKQQQESKKGLDQQQPSQSQYNKSDNKRKGSQNKYYMTENSENLPPMKTSITQQQNKQNEGNKSNRKEGGLQEGTQRISFEETINKILQENSQYTNTNYQVPYGQSIQSENPNYIQNIKPFETSRIDESQNELKSYSFQQNQEIQKNNNVSVPDKSYSFGQQILYGGVSPFYNQIQYNDSFSSKKYSNQPATERKRNNYFDSPRLENRFQNLTPQANFLQSPKSDIKSIRKYNNDSMHLNNLPPTSSVIGNIDTTRTTKSQEIQARTRRSLQDITSASRNIRLETQNDSYLADRPLPIVQGVFFDTLGHPYDLSLCANSKDLDELSQSQTIEYLKNLTVALQLRVQHLKQVEQENNILREDLQKIKGSRDACLKTQENISQVSLQETVKLQQELEGIIKNSRCYLEQLKESREEIEELKKQIQSEQNDKRDLSQQVNELQSRIFIQKYLNCLIDSQNTKDKIAAQSITQENNQLNLNLENIKAKELKDLLEKVIKEKNEAIKDNLNIKNDNIKLQQNLMELRLRFEELDQKHKQAQEQIILMNNGVDNKGIQEQLQAYIEGNKNLIQNIEILHEEKNSKQKEFNNLSSQYEEQILFLQKKVQNIEMQLREVSQTNLELQANNLELSLTLKNIECIQKTKQVLEEDLKKEVEKNSTFYLQFQSIKQSNEVLFHKLVRANEQVKNYSDQVVNIQEQLKATHQSQDITIQYLSYLSFLINDSYQPDSADPFDKLLNEQIRISKFSALIFIILRRIKSGQYQFGSQKVSVYIEDNQVKVKGSDNIVKYFERNIYTEIQKLISSLNSEKEKQYCELVQVQNKWLDIKI